MLRHVTSTLTTCVFVGAVSVFAQQPSSEQPPPKETLTGCVQEAKTTDGGTAYILNNAEGGSASAKMYVLAGPSQQTAVAANVNKKVEVTGDVRQPSAPPPDGADPNPKVVRPPIVQVESVKVVAEACR